MTLIIARTSAQSASMVSDRLVTKNKKTFDPDANKNILFADKNAVVTLGYTGLAYIGTTPTDRWIAERLTGMTFPQSRSGKNSNPAFMTTTFEQQYIGVRIRRLKECLDIVTSSLPSACRRDWVSTPFDLLITGYEWNRQVWRPLVISLSKPADSNEFQLDKIERNWYRARDTQFPVHIDVVPASNLSEDDWKGLEEIMAKTSEDAATSSLELANQAITLIAEAIRKVSLRLSTVGSDLMSILIPPPVQARPTIHVRFLAQERGEGVLRRGKSQMLVPVAFTPWVISSGLIVSPVIFSNSVLEGNCGPYRVIMEAPRVEQMPRVVSSHPRRSRDS